MKSVLIYEFNCFHYECLPGWAYYFRRLGYRVTVLSPEHPSFGDEFVRSGLEVDRVAFTPENKQQILLDLVTRNSFDVIFFNTIDHGEVLSEVSPVKEAVRYPVRYMGCAHCLTKFERFRDDPLLKDVRIVTLSAYSEEYVGTMVNAHHFGYSPDHAEKPDRSARIVGVGASVARYELEATLKRLKPDGRALQIVIVSKLDSFLRRLRRRIFFPICRLFHIRPYCDEAFRPDGSALKRYTHMTGLMTYEDMFEEIRSAQFLLMNVENTRNFFDHTVQTSGVKQLSLGLNRPCITSKNVARVYGFDETNALIYRDGQLAEALERAVAMSNGEYRRLCEGLVELQQRIEAQSLDNLSRILGE